MAHISLGSYSLPEDRCYFTRHIRSIFGKTGRRSFLHHQWVINGSLGGPGYTTATVDAARVAFDNNVVDGVDLVFSLGSTQSLMSANCANGTRVRELTWLPGFDGVRGSGAEDVNRRTFRLIIEGLVRVNSGSDIVEWHERVTGVGTGGPRTVPVGSLTGNVTAQQTQAFTKCEAIQTGYGIGLTQYPLAATPIWASGQNGVYEYFERRRNSPSTPAQWGINQNTLFRRDWSYHFFSTIGPLVGSPSFF